MFNCTWLNWVLWVNMTPNIDIEEGWLLITMVEDKVLYPKAKSF